MKMLDTIQRVTDITLGADPEFMAVDPLGNPMPICGLLGGTKEAPIRVDKGAYQEDNVNPEINIDPANTEDMWLEHLTSVIGATNRKLAPIKLRLAAIPSFHYTQYTLTSIGNKALEFGCHPDKNVWTGKFNASPNPYTTLRSAGGHIHFSLESGKVDAMVKMMDIYLGIPSVLLDCDKDRRNAYGKAGSFRPKKYGGEYRTLSNFWLRSEELMRWAYKATQRAYRDIDQVDVLIDRLSPHTIQTCINTSDEKVARGIVAELQLEVLR